MPLRLVPGFHAELWLVVVVIHFYQSPNQPIITIIKHTFRIDHKLQQPSSTPICMGMEPRASCEAHQREQHPPAKGGRTAAGADVMKQPV